MKCAICQQEFGDETVRIVNGEAVHEECYEKVQQMKAEEEKMNENQVVDVAENEVKQADAPQPKCEVIIGMQTDGNLYFLARGEDPSLLNIEGLLRFARKKMDQIWEQRMTARVEAPAADEASAE